MAYSEKVRLTASARLIQQLGEQLISDELVALLELIKNGYDADATNVDISIETETETEYGKGKIVIQDNGNGMMPSIIASSFLRLSSSFKEEERVSIFFKRRVLGKKGIGRLSFQRLGRYIKVYTTPRVGRLKKLIDDNDKIILRKNNSFRIDIDWFNFSMDKDLHDINADVYYSYEEKPSYGTKIEILGIRNQSFWDMDKNKINRLKKEIFGMVNPFVNNSEEKFSVNINVNGESYSNNNIDEDVLNKSCDVRIDFSFKDWIFKIVINRKNKYFIREKNKKISKMKESEFELLECKDHTETMKSYALNFNDIEKVNLDYPYLKKVKFDTIEREDKTIVKAYPGSFTGTIYASDFSPESRDYVKNLVDTKVFLSNKIRLYDEISQIWDAAKGVYIFRNKFRILPYGSKEWVGFTGKSQTYKNNIYKENTIAGYITIDGVSSEHLEEQTNRMGLIEDEYGKNFLNLIQFVMLEILVREDSDFRDGFNDNKKNINKEIITTNNGLLKFKKIITEDEIKNKTLEDIENAAKNAIDTNSNSKRKNSLKASNIKSKEEQLFELLKLYFSDESKIQKIIESQDTSIKAMLDIILKTMNQEDLLKTNIRELLGKIEDLKNIDSEISAKNKQELYIKDTEINEIKEILPLVGQGIIVESLTHELNRIDENIKTYAKKTINGLLKGIDKDELMEFQDNIIDETVYLSEQLRHIEPTYRKNYDVTQEIDIKDFLNELYVLSGPMVKKAKTDNIDVIIRGDNFAVNVNKGFLITVFDNLFLNSLHWINTINNYKKYVEFKIISDGTIEYSDSGPGVHPEMENKLFRPFESMKENGRGLGLYIVQELMGMMDADIYLSNERRNNRLFKFILKFNNVMEG